MTKRNNRLTAGGLVYNHAVLKSSAHLLLMASLSVATCAAPGAPPTQHPSGQPPVQINYLNVCTPPADEQKEIAASLARLPRKPAFATDFEVARGRSSAPDAPVSNWVRLRREFPAASPFSSVQYSFSVDEKGMAETLVFRFRDPVDLVQIALEDQVSSGTAAAVLAADTPVSRIRVERLGKTPRGLARCPEADQTTYQPLFATASEVMAQYRKALNVRTTVAADLARLGVSSAGAGPSKPAIKH